MHTQDPGRHSQEPGRYTRDSGRHIEDTGRHAQDPGGSRRLEGQIVAATAAFLALAGILVIGLSAPWEVRFPIVAAASLFGPAIPALRLFSGRTLMECVVYGVGVDVGLLMLVSLGLVMTASWYPAAAIIVILLISLAAAARLMMVSRTT